MKQPEGPEVQDDCPLIVEASCFAIHRSLLYKLSEAGKKLDRTDITETPGMRPDD
jgi:hypothetical protein